MPWVAGRLRWPDNGRHKRSRPWVNRPEEKIEAEAEIPLYCARLTKIEGAPFLSIAGFVHWQTSERETVFPD
jgi:hypothetical protein